MADQLSYAGRVVRVDADWPSISGYSEENLEGETRPENLAYVIYTSGSTGRPKGVMIRHRNALALLAWAESSFHRDALEHVLASTSLCFDLSVFELFVTWSVGGAVVLVTNILALSESPAFHQITLINTVPSVG